jgi:hypothetical protein
MSVYDDCFKRYGDHSPTAFDRNINIDDGDEVRSNWFVMPVSRTRDSGPLDESNFHSFLDGLGGESETVEVHRFGHWGPGWYEIIIVSPEDEKALKSAYDMAGSLENYPVLDEEDWSRREWEDFEESWDNWACKDFREHLVHTFSLYDSTSDLLDDVDNEDLRELFLQNSSHPFHSECSGVHVNVQYANVPRCELATLLWKARRDRLHTVSPR